MKTNTGTPTRVKEKAKRITVGNLQPDGETAREVPREDAKKVVGGRLNRAKTTVRDSHDRFA